MEDLTKLIRESYMKHNGTRMTPDGLLHWQGSHEYITEFSKLFKDRQAQTDIPQPAEMQLLLTVLKNKGCEIPATTEYMILLEGLRADERTKQICKALAKLSPGYQPKDGRV